MNARETVEAALRRAFSLGQTYWQQADSDSYRQNSLSHITRDKFDTLVEETLAVLAAPQPAPPQPAVPEEFEEALSAYGAERYADGEHDCAYNAGTGKARAEVLRLYALASAAPQRPTASREALWTAYANELRKGTPVGAFDNFCVALRALGIEVTP